MTALRSALERYLSMRQGLGYKYQHQARRLADFVTFMEKRKATTITTKLAVAWATLPPDRHASWTLRLTDVRGFRSSFRTWCAETGVADDIAEACLAHTIPDAVMRAFLQMRTTVMLEWGLHLS